MYSYERVLPIGSVVFLKGAQQRVMILGYQRMSADSSDKTIYDYCGCPYPQGFISPEKTAIFNHDMIERIISVGLQNEAYDKMVDKIREIVAEREAEE